MRGRGRYSAELDVESYFYGIEARATAHDTVARPVARERASIAVRDFPPGRLAVSDLLLADTIAARVSPARQRDDVRLVPKTSLTVRPGDAVHLYFEIYGLAADADGYAQYGIAPWRCWTTSPSNTSVSTWRRPNPEITGFGSRLPTWPPASGRRRFARFRWWAEEVDG